MWNFGDIVETVAGAAAPAAVAFIHGDRQIPWKITIGRMNNLARGIAAGGAQAGDKVAFYMRNGSAYGELAGACFLGRFVHVNVNYRYKADEVRFIVDNSDATVVVYGREFRATVAAIRDRLPSVRIFVEIGERGDAPAFARTYEDLAGRGGGAPLGIRRSDDDQILIYTGGTTGLPKGVVYRQGDLAPFLLGASGLFPDGPPRDMSGIADMLRRRGGAGLRYLPVCPQMHATGFFVTMWTLLTGGCVVTLEGATFDPAEVWRTVARDGVDNLAIVGDAFARPLLRALDQSPSAHDLRALAGIGSSGAMWSAEVKRGLLRHLPHVVLTDVFASTEAMGMGAAVATSQTGATTGGFATGAEAILIDEEDRPIPPGVERVGRIAVGGVQPLGYYKDPAKTAETFKIIDGRRYSVPGDHGMMTADGQLILLGRGSHCINTAGEKVYPEEVEEALKTHPAVDDALVIGIADETWGQAVTGIISLSPGAAFDETALQNHVRARLANYKAPKRIFVSDGDLRAPNGKADYRGAADFVSRQLAGAA